MGATFSLSSPPTETLLMRIEEYSKLTRAPVHEHYRNFMRFRDLWWDITVSSMRSNEEADGSEPDFVRVEVFLGVHCSPGSSLSTDISIEILDSSGLYTVFQCESSRSTNPTVQAAGRFLLLTVPRRELEASSCVRRYDDSFYVRCTIKEQPGFLENWFTSKSDVSRNVAMARGNTLTVGSLSQLNAFLLNRECAHSTHFAVGGSRWYLKLCPGLASVHLVHATREDDETRTTAEVSFMLEGAVNVQSEKMTHTFDRDNRDCAFAYQPPEEEPRPSTTSTDRIVVRCGVKVIPPVAPTAFPSPLPAPTIPAAVPRAAAISTTVPTPTESELTPLLSAMHG